MGAGKLPPSPSCAKRLGPPLLHDLDSSLRGKDCTHCPASHCPIGHIAFRVQCPCGGVLHYHRGQNYYKKTLSKNSFQRQLLCNYYKNTLHSARKKPEKDDKHITKIIVSGNYFVIILPRMVYLPPCYDSLPPPRVSLWLGKDMLSFLPHLWSLFEMPSNLNARNDAISLWWTFVRKMQSSSLFVGLIF